MKRLLLLGISLCCGLILHAQDWSLSGNALGSSDLLGSTNAFDLKIKTNNILRGTYTSAGKYGFGISTPRAYHELFLLFRNW